SPRRSRRRRQPSLSIRFDCRAQQPTTTPSNTALCFFYLSSSFASSLPAQPAPNARAIN
uniref:Uncharacterized protein n=1 Tax=Aegilops tauschii subsp. strangulata TaxID=200361 RepID=A0A453M5L4_AEGTS